MAFIFDDNDRFSERNWYYIRLIVEAFYEPGGTKYVINNVAYKDSQPQNDNPYSSGSPRSYSVPNGRAGSMTGSLDFQSDSDSGWSFQFDAGIVPQTQNIWGSGSFTRFIQETDSAQSVTISANHSLLGSASASTNIKHIFRTFFDANGGSVTPSFLDAEDGNSITLPSPSRSGYDFNGWLKNGSNVGGAGSSYTVSSTETLVASWTSSISDVNITDGISNRTVRRGQSSTYADFISATDKRSDHSSSGSDWALSGTYSNYFSINSLSSNDYLGWSIPTDAPVTSFTLTLTAYGPSSQDTDSATIDIKYPLPNFTDSTLGDGRVGVNYNLNGNNTISGDSNTSSWLISENIPGVGYTTNGSTATFSGVPTDFGDYNVTATLRNAGNENGESETISVTIKDASLSWVDQSFSTTTVVQGDTSYSDGVAVNSGPVSVTYSVTPGDSLPAGLNLNSSTGALTSDPTNGIIAEPGFYSFRIRATNGSNEVDDTQILSLTVEPAGGFMKVWTGASWEEAPAKVWVGSSWSEGTVKVWNGSAWVESFSS